MLLKFSDVWYWHWLCPIQQASTAPQFNGIQWHQAYSIWRKDTWASSRWWVEPGRGWQPALTPAPAHKTSSLCSESGKSSACGCGPSCHHGPILEENRVLSRYSLVPPVSTWRLTSFFSFFLNLFLSFCLQQPEPLLVAAIQLVS